MVRNTKIKATAAALMIGGLALAGCAEDKDPAAQPSAAALTSDDTKACDRARDGGIAVVVMDLVEMAPSVDHPDIKKILTDLADTPMNQTSDGVEKIVQICEDGGWVDPGYQPSS